MGRPWGGRKGGKVEAMAELTVVMGAVTRGAERVELTLEIICAVRAACCGLCCVASRRQGIDSLACSATGAHPMPTLPSSLHTTPERRPRNESAMSKNAARLPMRSAQLGGKPQSSGGKLSELSLSQGAPDLRYHLPHTISNAMHRRGFPWVGWSSPAQPPQTRLSRGWVQGKPVADSATHPARAGVYLTS